MSYVLKPTPRPLGIEQTDAMQSPNTAAILFVLLGIGIIYTTYKHG